MFAQILATLVIVVVCQAQVPHFGKCPPVTVKQNLDVSKYLGDWYEIEKFFFLVEGSQKCIRANYSLKADGHIQVFNRGIGSDGTEVTATGDGYPPDSNVAAKLAVEFNGSPRVPYWIVDTDYDQYSLVWSCAEILGFAQTDFAWILSRTKTLDPTIVANLKSKLSAFGIDVKSFNPTVQDKCPY